MITFGLYSLMVGDSTFQIWYGGWPKGYFSPANGNIVKGELVITYRNPYHTIPKRVIKELQKQFNPRINSW